MRRPACVFWANLTPFSPQSNMLPGVQPGRDDWLLIDAVHDVKEIYDAKDKDGGSPPAPAASHDAVKAFCCRRIQFL